MIDPQAPTTRRALNKYLGEVGTIASFEEATFEGSACKAARLAEFPGILVNELWLIPLNDDHEEAFERFMKKLELDKEYNPWLHDEV